MGGVPRVPTVPSGHHIFGGVPRVPAVPRGVQSPLYLEEYLEYRESPEFSWEEESSKGRMSPPNRLGVGKEEYLWGQGRSPGEKRVPLGQLTE